MRDATEDAIREGAMAATLMGDPVLQDVLASIEADFVAVWRDSAFDAVQKREDAFRMLKAMDAFKSELARRIADGQVAERVLRDKEQAAAVARMSGIEPE